MHFNIIAEYQCGYMQTFKKVGKKFKKYFVVYFTCSQVFNRSKTVLATIMVAKTFKFFSADLFACERKRQTNFQNIFRFQFHM